MDLTTKTIIKTLPFEDQFKQELLNQFDFLTPDQKMSIEQVLWNTYFALYQLKLDEKLQEAFIQAKENKITLDKDFFAKIEQQVHKDMQNESIQKVEGVDLAAARKAMEIIVKEIRASKKNVS